MRFEGPFFHPPAWKHPWYRGKITIWIRSGKETHNNSSSWHRAAGKSQDQESGDLKLVSQLQVWEGVRALSGSSASLLLPFLSPYSWNAGADRGSPGQCFSGFNVRILPRCADLGTAWRSAFQPHRKRPVTHVLKPHSNTQWPTPRDSPDPKGVVFC